MRTPSGRMPRSSHRPVTPPPLPIDTTDRAETLAARTDSIAPTDGATGGGPGNRSARARAAPISSLSVAKRSA